VACSTLLSLGYFQDSANIFVVSAGFVKSVGVVFNQSGSGRKVAVASWLFKADAVAC